MKSGPLTGLAAAAVLAAGAVATILPASVAGAAGHVRGDAAVCGAVPTGFARCNLHTVTVNGRPAPAATSPSGYGPSDLQSAYSTPSGNGSGVTVAIVDAYDDPTAASDLAVYRRTYGLPPADCASGHPCFTKMNQNGGTTSFPKANGGWAQEESLDVDMVSAICPNCNILLVEASSNSYANLFAAEDTASARASYVSNSWGGSEGSSETTYDSHFNKSGKVFTVSSGDNGYGVEYPASSRYVTAVGGTSLRRASSTTRGWSETAWSGAGSGCSAYESQPSWQAISSITAHCSRRAVADVAAVADPNTGVAVYDTYSYHGQSGWLVFGGTSVASPVVASVYALSGNTSGASYAYAHTGGLFDVTSGSNGSCGSNLCTATAGWDGPTGLGTPNSTTAF